MPFLDTYFPPKQDIPARAYVSTQVLVGCLILGGWCLATYGGLVDPVFMPAPHQVLVAAWDMAQDGTLLHHIATSCFVIFSGFFLASIIAVPLGILMGTFKLVEAATEHTVNFVRYLPVSAMIPLLILWVGIDFREKITIIFIGTFFQQLILISDVARRVPRELLDVSYTLGANRRNVVGLVLIPATLPGVMDTLRVTMGWAWTYLVVAELVASSAGLGYMILNAMRGLQTDVIFVGIAVIGLLGLATDWIFKQCHNLLLPWSPKH